MGDRIFNVVVERDPDTGWYVGEVVELPGCYTQAPDLEVLQDNIREAIHAYMKNSDQSSPPDSDYFGTQQIRVAV